MKQKRTLPAHNLLSDANCHANINMFQGKPREAHLRKWNIKQHQGSPKKH